ncbi:hypothetical protein EMIT0P100_150028 [Pseudomonas sp. IT-P100]
MSVVVLSADLKVTPLWPGSSLPLGCEAAPQSCERCALKREQAPSPQKLLCHRFLPGYSSSKL